MLLDAVKKRPELTGLSPYLIDFIPDDSRPTRELFTGCGDILRLPVVQSASQSPDRRGSSFCWGCGVGNYIKHGQHRFGIRSVKHKDTPGHDARPPHLIQRRTTFPDGDDLPPGRIGGPSQQKRLRDPRIQSLNSLLVRFLKPICFVWCYRCFQDGDYHMHPLDPLFA